MCGFAVVLNGRPLDAADVESVLIRRGPDGRGEAAIGDGWGLHRRLAIIDLSEGSAQPMALGDDVQLFYNGEVYNYEQLRSLGVFQTDGDTEVFGRALLEGTVGDLRGMFAGVATDGSTGRFARDRFGIKPLYRSATAGAVAIASQLRCVPALTGQRSINADAVASVLRFGSVVGATMFGGVEEITPGTHGVIDGEVSTLGAPAVPQRTLGDSIRAAVGRHLVADVPIALLLSGGVDSAVLGRAIRDVGGDATAITLSPGGEVDESARARRTAKEFGFAHRVVEVRLPEVVADIDAFFDAADQPSIDGLNTFLVSRAVHDAGFSVALSGLGGDELFGGYSSFRRAWATHQLRHLPAPAVRRLLAVAGAPPHKLERWVEHRGDLGALAAISREVFSPAEVRRLCGTMWDPPVRSLPGGDPLIDAEVSLYMTPTLLRDSDAHSMAHSVELRVPFLDDELVAHATRRSTFDRARRGKRVLAEALDDDHIRRLAAEPKTGFRLPIDEWLRADFGDRLDAALSHGSPLSAVVDVDEARLLGANGPWSRQWVFVVLNEWLVRHG